MGIKPPKGKDSKSLLVFNHTDSINFLRQTGVILYGVPGTGKTLLAKAVANQTSATFLRIVGSELIQKYLGDGPKLVRELFRVAEELAPSIVFIDEIDAIGTKRYASTFEGSILSLADQMLPTTDTTLIQEENEKFNELCWSC